MVVQRAWKREECSLKRSETNKKLRAQKEEWPKKIFIIEANESSSSSSSSETLVNISQSRYRVV